VTAGTTVCSPVTSAFPFCHICDLAFSAPTGHQEVAVSSNIVTIDQLDIEISLAHIAVGSSRGRFSRCPSAENEQRVEEAVAEVDRLLDQRLAAHA
jgi:hypothetical protein